MDDIQKRFESEWKIKFPVDHTPILHNVSHQWGFGDHLSDTTKRPREILQKLYNCTIKRTEELKQQLEQCKFIETFLHGILSADNDSGDYHYITGSNVENGTSDSHISSLKNFVKSSVKINSGILLESNIDEIHRSNHIEVTDIDKKEHSQESKDGHVLPETELAEPPKTELLATQICDNKNSDGRESNIDIQQNSIQQKCHRKCNSSQENQRTINSDPLPRKFSEPSKSHNKPAVPPRKDKSLSKHDDVEIAPIRCVNGPIFKSTINVSQNLTFRGNKEITETDLDADLNINDRHKCNLPQEEDSKRLSTGNKEIDFKPDFDIDSSEEKMRKIRKKSNNQENVVVTSFKRISQENESVDLQVDSNVKCVENNVHSDHLPVVKRPSDKPPGLPDRKPSMDMSQIENESNLRKKRQSRNDYENISLDFILTRAQQDSPEESDDDDEIYDNVTQYRRKDPNVLGPADKVSNNLDNLSISSGGDYSASSAGHSPTGRFKFLHLYYILCNFL